MVLACRAPQWANANTSGTIQSMWLLRNIVAIAAGTMLALSATSALAVCTATALTTATPGTVTTGTYTGLVAPTAQLTTYSVTVRYTNTVSGEACSILMSFQRASLPATMSNGTATTPYTVQSAFGGGNTLLFAGSTVSLANTQSYSFTAATGTGTNRTATFNANVYFLMQPATQQAAGSYTDNLTMYVFPGAGGTSFGSRAVTVNGTVAKYCTINGVATGTTDTATIPVSALGAVTTSVINRSYANVLCNVTSNVQLSSANGAVRIVTSPPSGFTNQINYSSTASFSGANAVFDTSSNPAATGAESGGTSTTTSALPTGTLAVTITPQATAQPLLPGSYSDVLTVSIIPQ
jgi:hypothetical protein